MSGVLVSPSVIAQRKDLPRRYPGLVGWLRGGVGIAASGGLVDSWTDPTTGLQVTSSGGNRPTDSSLLGVQCPLFVSASSTRLQCDLPAALSAYTVICVHRVGAADASQGVWRFGDAVDALMSYAFNDVPGNTHYHQLFGGPNRTLSDASAPLDTNTVNAYVLSGSRTALFELETKIQELGTSAGLSCAKLRLGDIVNAAYFYNGKILDFLLYNQDLGDTAILAICKYLRGLRGI